MNKEYKENIQHFEKILKEFEPYKEEYSEITLYDDDIYCGDRFFCKLDEIKGYDLSDFVDISTHSKHLGAKSWSDL